MRRYLVICLLIVFAIVVPRRAFATSDQYKSGVPVTDYVEKERPQGNITREIKTLQKPNLIYRLTLSPQFLAGFLSFLMLFLSAYVYIRYIKPAARMSRGEHRSRHKTTHPKPPEKTDISDIPSDELQEKKEESEEDEELSEQNLEGEGIEEFTEEPEPVSKQVNLLQFKEKRDEHAQRIYHLLDKL